MAKERFLEMKLDKSREVTVEVEKYEPSNNEIQDVVSFFNVCNRDDLVSGWIKISKEWDFNSIMTLHRTICDSGRINDLVEGLSSGVK